MATQNINVQINAAVESAEAARSLGSLRRSLLDIQRIQGEIGDESSPEFQRLQRAAQQTTARLASTREAIGDISDSVRTLDGSPVERLRNSFGLLGESIVNLDFDKLKIGLEGIKAAVLSNPLTPIIAAIAAVVAGITALLAAFGFLDDVISGAKVIIASLKRSFDDLTDSIGITSKAEERLTEAITKGSEKRIAAIEREAQIRKTYAETYGNLTDAQKEQFEKLTKLQLDNIGSVAEEESRLAQQRFQEAQKRLDDQLRINQGILDSGRLLTAEQIQQVRDLGVARQKAEDERNQADARLAAERNKAYEDFEKQRAKIEIEGIQNSNTRRRREIEASRVQELNDFEEQLQKENIGYDKAEAYRAAINRKYNLQIREFENGLARERAQKGLDDLEESFRLQILKTEENSEDRIILEEKFRTAQLEYMRKHQRELELSNDEIAIKEQEHLDEMEGKHKTFYQNDLNNFQTQLDIKLEKTQAGTVDRLKVEQENLNALIRYYEENYEKLGLTEDQFQLKRLQLQNQLQSKIKESADFEVAQREAVGLITSQSAENLAIRIQQSTDQILQHQVEGFNKMLEKATEESRLLLIERRDEFVKVFSNGVDAIRGLYEAVDAVNIGAAQKFGAPFKKTIDELQRYGFESNFRTISFMNLLLKQSLTETTREELKAGKIREDDLKRFQGLLGDFFQIQSVIQGRQAQLAELALQNTNRVTKEHLKTYQEVLDGTVKGIEFVDGVISRGRKMRRELGKQLLDAQIVDEELFFQKEKALAEKAQFDFLSQETAKYEENLLKYGKNAADREKIELAFQESLIVHDALHKQTMEQLEQEHLDRIKAMNEKNEEDIRAIRRRRETEGVSLAKESLGAIQNLTSIFYTAKLAQVKKNSKEEEKIAREQFAIQKAFNIGLAVINGLQSILAITSVPDFTLGVQTAIRIAAQVALNAATIAGIAAQQYNGPVYTAPSGGGGGGGGGGAGGVYGAPIPSMGGAPPPAPTFQPAEFFTLGMSQFLGGGGGGPQRVYVLETDITETQTRVSVLEQRAKLL